MRLRNAQQRVEKQFNLYSVRLLSPNVMLQDVFIDISLLQVNLKFFKFHSIPINWHSVSPTENFQRWKLLEFCHTILEESQNLESCASLTDCRTRLYKLWNVDSSYNVSLMSTTKNPVNWSDRATFDHRILQRLCQSWRTSFVVLFWPHELEELKDSFKM